MAMSYGARVSAARTPGEFVDQVTAAISGHARWVQENEAQSLSSKKLAAEAARDPLGITQSMALMVLRLPRNDALETTDDLTDPMVTECVGEAWPAFVRPE